MPVAIQPETPPLRTDPDGTIRVGKSRIVLERIVRAFQDGATPQSIADNYPTVTLADVYGVIAYYLRHRAEVDVYVAERERQANELQRRIEAEYGSQEGLRGRLLDRLQSRTK